MQFWRRRGHQNPLAVSGSHLNKNTSQHGRQHQDLDAEKLSWCFPGVRRAQKSYHVTPTVICREAVVVSYGCGKVVTSSHERKEAICFAVAGIPYDIPSAQGNHHEVP